jgi:hypothetical protein
VRLGAAPLGSRTQQPRQLNLPVVSVQHWGPIPFYTDFPEVESVLDPRGRGPFRMTRATAM